MGGAQMRGVFLAMGLLLVAGCASMAEDQRLQQLTQTVEVNGRRWDFARDGDYLYARPAGFQAIVNDMRFKREAVAAAETHSGCRFTDPVWDENLISTWVVMGRLECTPPQ